MQGALLGRMNAWIAFSTQRQLIKWRFRKNLGYYGNFENPRTYQEKLQFRKLYGNHAFYALVADKFRVRDYVAERAGREFLIPLLGVYDRLDHSDFESLPQQFIIKANHGCKWHQVVRDKSGLDVDATVQRFNRLMRKQFGFRSGERHYSFIEPRIVIEELLQGVGVDQLPWDYSFFCYNGPAGFDYNFSVVDPGGSGASFDKSWHLLESHLDEARLAPHLQPANFDAMVQVAQRLSADFDFVRVDLYNVRGRVYFGELTCTPAQGFGRILDERRQRMRDEMWHLAAANPLLYRPPK